MNKFENDLFIKYFDQLSVSIKNNISELQQALTHINSIKAEAFDQRTLHVEKSRVEVAHPSLDISSRSPNELIRLKEVMRMTALGRSSIYKLMNEGGFPMSVHLSTRAIAWKRAAILQWIETRI